jgi:hypothetical protein
MFMGEGLVQPCPPVGLVEGVTWDAEAGDLDAGEAVLRPKAKAAPATRSADATTSAITVQLKRRRGGGEFVRTAWGSFGTESVMEADDD